MSNLQIQKDKEYDQLKLFLDTTDFIGCDDIIRLSEDPPDFALQHGNNLYAVELTELIVKTNRRYSLRELEAYEDEILHEVWKRLETVKLPCSTVEVQVFFNIPINPQRGYSKDDIIQPLTDLIVTKVKRWGMKRYNTICVEDTIIPGISMVLIRSGICKGIQYLSTNSIRSASVHLVSIDPYYEVLETIRKKEKILPRYQKKYSKSFLILTANRCRGSQAFELTDRITNVPFATEFDGVFFLDYFTRLAIKLKTLPRA